MEEIGTYNDRKLIYQRHSLDIKWTDAFPNKNWLLLVFVESKARTILDEISRKAIDNDVCDVCCAGQQSELLHDMIDEEIVLREVGIEDRHVPPHDIMTTWHFDFGEAVWFAFFAAHNPPEDINTIVCLDASELGIKFILNEIVEGFN
jgi:hypothetical protein